MQSKTNRIALTDIPNLAREDKTGEQLFRQQREIPTTHRLYLGDSRNMSDVESDSVHLVVTSPPYWTLKKYPDIKGQLGHVADYESFLSELEKVFRECHRVLVPGGRLICVVGDVCLSRKLHGRHMVMPLHSDIVVRCRKIGFDNLAPIIWYKIANAKFEANTASTILGKPYEPNAVIKNDIEFILILRKPGEYRKVTDEQRKLSYIPRVLYEKWFRQIWDIKGESTKKHPAPFPLELALRLVRMYSFVGDTVLDPFNGTGTTMIAAMESGRNSVGYEIDPGYFDMAKARLEKPSCNLFNRYQILTKKT
jgi:site-specific DNA-methyltransferase (adenine-specific)